MALVHEVHLGPDVRSRVTVDGVPVAGPRVLRLGSGGQVIDAKGQTVDGKQVAPKAPLFSLPGLTVIVIRVGWLAIQLCAKAAHHGTLLFGICAWNVTHFSLMVVNGLSQRALEHMDDYAVQRHRVLAPWLERHDQVKELPADVVEEEVEPKQLPEDTVVTQLTKSKKKVSA